jgi:hypothetical protein
MAQRWSLARIFTGRTGDILRMCDAAGNQLVQQQLAVA